MFQLVAVHLILKSWMKEPATLYALIRKRREAERSAQIWMAKFMSENLDISHRTLRIIMKLCLRMMVQYGSMKESIIKIHTTEVSV